MSVNNRPRKLTTSAGKRLARQSVIKAIDRLASFGKRHKLSLGGIKLKDLVNHGRR
jgi:hypothetical protein